MTASFIGDAKTDWARLQGSHTFCFEKERYKGQTIIVKIKYSPFGRYQVRLCSSQKNRLLHSRRAVRFAQ